MQEWGRYARAAHAAVCGTAATCLVAVAIFKGFGGRRSARHMTGMIAEAMSLAVSWWVLASPRRLSFEARHSAVASGPHTILVIGRRNKTVTPSATSPRRTPAGAGMRAWRMDNTPAAGDTGDVINADGSHR
jgi:hypothetical protein